MKSVLRAVALGVAFTCAVTAVPALHAAAPAQDQDHRDDHPEYAHNRFYKLGNTEGYHDYRRHTTRTEHNHHYGSDTDRQAHDYGYQQGLNGQRGYHHDSNPH